MTEQRAEPTAAVWAARRTRDEVHEAMVGLEQAVASAATGRTGPWASEVLTQLEELRRGVIDHVDATEGRTGLFAEVLETAPRLRHAVDRLRSEHAGIVRTISDVEHTLTGVVGGGDEIVADVRDEVLALLGLLTRHRQHGADLVWEAYEVDVGPAD